MQAILTGKEIIDEPVIMRAVRLLSIEIPKKYAKGSYISDFTDEAGYEPVDDVEEVKGPAEGMNGGIRPLPARMARKPWKGPSHASMQSPGGGRRRSETPWTYWSC